jgi:dsDNA-specific endonuclease/ATPase MutS2
MTSRFAPGQAVQTPLGRGVILEVRNARRVLVQVQGRAVVLDVAAVSPVAASGPGTPAPPATPRRRARAGSRGRQDDGDSARVRSVDLHGLTTDDALEAMHAAIDAALLADIGQLRLIHGRSGGRLRAVVHTGLRQLTVVRSFRLDPRNAGVTIVYL